MFHEASTELDFACESLAGSSAPQLPGHSLLASSGSHTYPSRCLILDIKYCISIVDISKEFSVI